MLYENIARTSLVRRFATMIPMTRSLAAFDDLVGPAPPVRHAVCWRKTSYGTNSAAGSRFVERVLTVVASCRQQVRDVLGFLVDTVHAVRTGVTLPSLVPARA